MLFRVLTQSTAFKWTVEVDITYIMNNFANETTVYRRECGSVMAQEELKIEDKTNFHMVLLVFFVTIFVMYLIFGLWHGVTKCKYWKSIKARYLYETRLQTGCCPIKQNVRKCVENQDH